MTTHHAPEAPAPATSRRALFGRVADGFLGAALAGLATAGASRASPSRVAHAGSDPAPGTRSRPPHLQCRARSIIQLFMTGGPSQVDLLDPKPALREHAGELPRAFLDSVESVGAAHGLLPSYWDFHRHGESGLEISELLPHLAASADRLAVIRSMWSPSFNHEPGVFLMHTGRQLLEAPTMGAWIVYGLGSENENLPAYVALDDPHRQILCGKQNWQAGWLPPICQGTRLRTVGSPIINLRPRQELPSPVLEASRNLLSRMAERHRRLRPGHPQLDARIESYELAARMQIAATDALDIDREGARTRALYGLDDTVTASYGRRCLMARRLVERGVRVVQIFMNCSSSDNPWDHHGDIRTSLARSCAQTDRPIGALLVDLEQRGLLDSTLVVWGGEFGRLPLAQSAGKPGRDHGANGFSVWLAGAGVKGGTVHGATDDFGYHAVENRCSIPMLHATILRLMGLDHERLVYSHHGLDERLTGVEPVDVVDDILA